MRRFDAWVERALQALAFSSVAALLSITFFIFKEGVPFVYRIGLENFFSGDWHPTAGLYGIRYMVVGSALVTAGALVFGVPLGVGCAVVLGEMASPAWRAVLKPTIEILAGIPSVVFGFIGITLVLPWIRALNSKVLRPDLTIIVDVNAATAARRRQARGADAELFEVPEIQERLATVYRNAEMLVPDDLVVHVDGEQNVARVAAEIWSRVEPLL